MPPRTPNASRTRLPAYARSADYYDAIYAWKDYAGEARRIRALVARFGPSRARTLLDVACGTGSHLARLRRWYEVTGVDRDPAMLRVARRKLPGVRLVRAPMQTFDLGRQFDVVTCLFSAIGYVPGRRDLRRTARRLAAHLAPGGLALVEAWLTPGQYRAGGFHAQLLGTEERPIARMNLSERRGDRSILDMHHLAAGPRGVEHWVERHDLGLFTEAEYVGAFRAAGLRARFLRDGLHPGRGLVVAVRPRERPRRLRPTRGSSSRRRPRGS